MLQKLVTDSSYLVVVSRRTVDVMYLANINLIHETLRCRPLNFWEFPLQFQPEFRPVEVQKLVMNDQVDISLSKLT